MRITGMLLSQMYMATCNKPKNSKEQISNKPFSVSKNRP
jgi:hypothetical protein